MLTFPDLFRTLAQSALEVGAFAVAVLFVVNLFGLRRDIREARQAIRTGVRKRSQLR